jgi:hypothetical protein
MSQPFYETGRLPLYNIQPSDYVMQHPQNHDLIQKGGLIYIGNNGGVLVHDGVNWIRIAQFDNKVLAIEKNHEDDFFKFR